MESTRPTMSGCMQTGKPLISILMAVYEPRMDWLREQLLSLNAQTYPNLRLYVRDDCSPMVAYAEIQSCVQDCISAFPYTIQRNEKNLGSNGTFERLTQEAEGDYFAYCDQDDIWSAEKLKILHNHLVKEEARLICSDMRIINGSGKVVANSITEVRRRHVLHSGENLAKQLLFFNFVTGCTMMISSTDAKAALPFCPYYVHDHYLALFCATKGKIISLPTPLIDYRIHQNNQTVEMAGVTDKKSYGAKKIETALCQMRWLKAHFFCPEELIPIFDQAYVWAEARKKNWEHRGGIIALLKYRSFSPLTSLFEIVGAWLPNRIFMFFVELKRKNKV